MLIFKIHFKFVEKILLTNLFLPSCKWLSMIIIIIWCHFIFVLFKGSYWIDPNDGLPNDAIKVRCEHHTKSTCLYPVNNSEVISVLFYCEIKAEISFTTLKIFLPGCLTGISGIFGWRVRISEIQLLSDFPETFLGNFHTICLSFESVGIFGWMEGMTVSIVILLWFICKCALFSACLRPKCFFSL